MNPSALIELADYLEQIPDDQFSMHDWIDGNTVYQTIFRSQTPPCGTVGCIAGHAIALFTGMFGYHTGGGVYLDGDGNENINPSVRAGQLLGFSLDQAESVFTGEWPERINAFDNDRKAAIALLRGLVDGTIEFDEDGGLRALDPVE